MCLEHYDFGWDSVFFIYLVGLSFRFWVLVWLFVFCLGFFLSSGLGYTESSEVEQKGMTHLHRTQ